MPALRELDPRVVGPETPDYAAYIAVARRLRAQAFSDAASTALRGLARVVSRGVVEPLRRRRTERRRYAELASLSNRTLKDIGISRSDIPAIVRGTWDRERARPPALVEIVVDNGGSRRMPDDFARVCRPAA